MNKVIKYVSLLLVMLLILPNLHSAEQKRRRGGRVGKKITFLSKDGVIINGLYMPPISQRKKTFILLHGLGSNQEEWQPFIRNMQKYGNGFLSYDARGHGESVTTKDGKEISYTSFGTPSKNSNWNKMIPDLEMAVNYLITEKGIAKEKIGLIGASLGANTCLIYSASNKAINPVVLLSPGLNYAGLDTQKSILAFQNPEEEKTKNRRGRPLAIVASPNDTYSYQSSFLLYKQVQTNKHVLFIQGSNSNHGVQMLDKSITAKILNWIQQY